MDRLPLTGCRVIIDKSLPPGRVFWVGGNVVASDVADVETLVGKLNHEQDRRTVEAAFLADIIAHPGDDAPRLIFADWLDDHGDPERGEFIRVQCELARDWATVNNDSVKRGLTSAGRRRHPRFAHLAGRERELLEAQGHIWLAPFAAALGTRMTPAWRWTNVPILFRTNQGDVEPAFRRGFVADVTLPCAAWLGTPCHCCGGSGKRWSARSGRRHPCSNCRRTGRAGGYGPALMRAAPLEKVTLADRWPEQDGKGSYLWRKTSWVESPHSLPGPIFDRLFGGTRFGDVMQFSSSELALSALSAACLAWSRGVATAPAQTTQAPR